MDAKWNCVAHDVDQVALEVKCRNFLQKLLVAASQLLLAARVQVL